MQHSEFVAKLRKINPAIRFRPGRNISSGLYLVNNGPDAHEIGLRHLCGIPSPRLFLNIPKHNWVDENNVWHRGWKVVLRILVDKKVLCKAAVDRLFGTSWKIGPNGAAMEFERQKTVQEKMDDRIGRMTLADRKTLYGGVTV